LGRVHSPQTDPLGTPALCASALHYLLPKINLNLDLRNWQLLLCSGHFICLSNKYSSFCSKQRGQYGNSQCSWSVKQCHLE